MQHGNPLFPSSDDTQAENSYVLPRAQKPIAPIVPLTQNNGVNAAIDLIRDKLARIYAEAPNTFAKFMKPEVPLAAPSKHQRFMQELQHSGRSLADIQTAWHNYYVALPDHEKHQVWQEFYEANAAMRRKAPAQTEYRQPIPRPRPQSQLANGVTVSPAPDISASTGTVGQIKQRIRDRVTAGGRLQVHHHLQSLGFGLAIGVVTLIITLFGFFNEVVIAPFIQPGRASATPIIIDPNAQAVGATPEVIIPKINLEIPVDYTQTSNDESAIQSALENGIVHYPSTVLPGQTGNAAFFGHSSNNIFNPGKYKFAFVLLHELQPGDTFYLTYGGKSYVYKVFKRVVVEPDEVGVLNNIPDHTATATLITCDPPGTALHRLVVVGDQISPDPSANTSGQNTIANDSSSPITLPDNGPSLWDRFIQLFTGN